MIDGPQPGEMWHADPIGNPAHMSHLIKGGVIWNGGPETHAAAIEYLRAHPDEVNDFVPRTALAELGLAEDVDVTELEDSV